MKSSIVNKKQMSLAMDKLKEEYETKLKLEQLSRKALDKRYKAALTQANGKTFEMKAENKRLLKQLGMGVMEQEKKYERLSLWVLVLVIASLIKSLGIIL